MRSVALIGLMAAWAAHAPAWAQAAPASASAPASAASAADAAMERARRQAANPLRIILEASKTRRKPGEADAADTADAPSQRTVNTRVAPLTSAGGQIEAAAIRQAQPATPRTPAVVATPAASPAPTPAPPVADAAPIEAQITLSSAALQSRADAAPVAGLAPVVPASALGALPAPVSALPPPPPAAPKLITMVEPVLPARALVEAGSVRELPVDLVIRPDGTVASATVAAAAPRQLVRAVVQALEQWRFEPLPAERVHRVQLVFGDLAR